MAKVTEAQKRKNYEATVGSSENDMKSVPKSKSVPVKVIKAGDMSPETKALPNEVVKPPKGIGSSEKDMSPLPKKDTNAPIKKAAPKPDYEGEMGYSPEEMAEVEQARKRLAKQGIYKKGGMVKSSASKRADGIAVKGKTRGKIC